RTIAFSPFCSYPRCLREQWPEGMGGVFPKSTIFLKLPPARCSFPFKWRVLSSKYAHKRVEVTMTTNNGLQREARLKRQGNLQREVLEYLAEYGPKKRERLCAGLGDEISTVEIESVLAELRQLGYLEIGVTDTVLLTATGRAWLEGAA